jgi:hypothetical protein
MFRLVPYDVDTKPGAWVERQAQRRLVYLLVGATFVAVFGVLAASLSHDYVLEALIFGVLVCVAIAAHDRIELAVPWLKGAHAESAVGAELEELRRDGYIVMHDVMFGGEGISTTSSRDRTACFSSRQSSSGTRCISSRK